jgi:Uma2 family endonuclease
VTAAKKTKPISVEDYLQGELVSPIKHEYLGGVVYAMAGANNRHNLIASNVLIALGARLRGQACRPFNSDTKIRVRLPAQVRFYYPDVSVICRPNPQTESFQDEPVVLFEVLSQGTRRIDEGEKKDAYLTIPSLSVYILVDQNASDIVIYRRSPQGFVRELYEGMEAVLSLPEIKIDFPLVEIYEAVEFPSGESTDDES